MKQASCCASRLPQWPSASSESRIRLKFLQFEHSIFYRIFSLLCVDQNTASFFCVVEEMLLLLLLYCTATLTALSLGARIHPFGTGQGDQVRLSLTVRYFAASETAVFIVRIPPSKSPRTQHTHWPLFLRLILHNLGNSIFKGLVWCNIGRANNILWRKSKWIIYLIAGYRNIWQSSRCRKH